MMKRHFTFPKAPELKPHQWMQFTVIPRNDSNCTEARTVTEDIFFNQMASFPNPRVQLPFKLVTSKVP